MRALELWMCVMGLAGALGLGCQPAGQGQDASPQLERLLAQPSKPASADDPIIAKLGDDQVITLSQLELFWREHPGLDRQRALDQLIAQELFLAQLPKDDASSSIKTHLAYDYKRGLVKAWLDSHVERPNAQVDEASLKMWWEQATARLSRPDGFVASHLLVLVPRDYKDTVTQKTVPLSEDAREPLMQAAQQFAITQLEPRLEGKPADVKTLEALRDELQQQAQALGLRLVVNAQMTFAAPGHETAALPTGWINPIPEFAQAAQAVFKQRGLGEASEAVMTPFGAHIMVIHEQLPALTPDEAQVRALATQLALNDKRRLALEQRLPPLIKSASFSTMPQALTSLATQ